MDWFIFSKKTTPNGKVSEKSTVVSGSFGAIRNGMYRELMEQEHCIVEVIEGDQRLPPEIGGGVTFLSRRGGDKSNNCEGGTEYYTDVFEAKEEYHIPPFFETYLPE